MKREIKVYRDLMGANEKWAQKTREWLAAKKLSMLNIIGAPGAGKTALLGKTQAQLGDALKFAVLEGDVETTRDAERLAAQGIPVSQLLTGGACHLEAKLVHYALRDLPADEIHLVIVENVGNMVCPAEFDIGEKAKIAVTSITEGEDKALKYPLLFREARAVVLTKLDLLPHVPFDLETCRKAIRQINPHAPLFELSALTGEGMPAWADWVRSQR
jgi:hydrogenase nickel incorporation protein HypB